MTLRHPDVIGAALVALTGMLVIVAGLTTPDPGFGVVGPAAFPIAIGVLMLVVAVWLAWDTLRKSAPLALEALDRRPFFATAAATAIFLLAFEPLGFLITGAAYMVVQARIFGSRDLVRDIIASVLFMAALYLLFARFLTIDLPTGPLPL